MTTEIALRLSPAPESPSSPPDEDVCYTCEIFLGHQPNVAGRSDNALPRLQNLVGSVL